jgi:hypothetical protein
LRLYLLINYTYALDTYIKIIYFPTFIYDQIVYKLKQSAQTNVVLLSDPGEGGEGKETQEFFQYIGMFYCLSDNHSDIGFDLSK